MRHKPSQARIVLFILACLVTITGNILAGCLNYVVWSDGEFGQTLYREIASTGALLPLVTLACAVFGFIMTAVTYLLSLDPGRSRRPTVVLYFLFASFLFFVAGYLLGSAKVPSDNIPAFAVAMLLVFLLPVAVPFVEKYAGKALLGVASATYSSGAVANALFFSRLGLALKPHDRDGEDTFGLALADSGHITDASPFLEEAYSRGSRRPELLRFLAQEHHSRGDFGGELGFVEQLHTAQPTAKLFERMIDLLEKTGNQRLALQEIEDLSGEEHRKWLPKQLDLCFELDDLNRVRQLAAEMEHEGPPFTHARDAYSRILKVSPDDKQCLEALVELDTKAGAAAEAAANLERLVMLHPDHPGYRRRLVAHYRQAGANDPANRHLEALLAHGQANLREKLEVLEGHFALGDYARVESLLASDEELRNDPRGAYILAATLFDTRRLEKAIEQVQVARRLDPDAEIRSQLTAIENRARAQINAREIESLADRVHEDPENLDLRFALCDRLVASGTADKAVVEMEELVQRKPELKQRILRELRGIQSLHGKNFRLLAYECDIHQRDADWDKVHDLVLEMAKASLDPENVLYEGATRILDSSPGHVPALRTLAETASRTGKHEVVLSSLDRLGAADAEPPPEALRMRYDALRGLGRMDEAIVVATELAVLQPDNSTLFLELATMRHDKGDFDGALAALDRARELDPENLELRRQARDYEDKRKRARMATLAETVKVEPDRAGLWEELGDLHHDFGEYNEAIVAYQKASMKPEFHDVANAKLGYVLACKGMFVEAQEAFGEVQLRTDQQPTLQKTLKALLYSTAELMVEEKNDAEALVLYRRIFRVDAGYRDVVSKIEVLQRTEKPRR